MAYKCIVIVFLTTVTVNIAIGLPLNEEIMSMDHAVGDDKGWSVGVDYAAWIQSQQFCVGDKLGIRRSKKLQQNDQFMLHHPLFRKLKIPLVVLAWRRGLKMNLNHLFFQRIIGLQLMMPLEKLMYQRECSCQKKLLDLLQ